MKDEDHLSKHGWTLQETLLSPRTIHYSATELKWNCQKRSCFEIKPNEDPDNPHREQGFLILSNFLSIDKKNLETGYRNAFQRWYNILDDYAFRALSVSSDKLPAISGLAHEFSNQIHSTYKAGIWLEDIHCGLIWSYSEHGIKPDSYRAPSWSWAAMDCFRTGKSDSPNKLYFWLSSRLDKHSIIAKAEVLDIEVILKDNDPYGAVIGGELTLRTFWVNWPWKRMRGSDTMRTLQPIVAKRIYTKYLVYRDLDCNFDEVAKKEPTYSNPDYYLDVSLVQVMRDRSSHFALLLKPAKGEGNEGKFVRVGVAQLPCERKESGLELTETEFGLTGTGLEQAGWVKRDVTII